MPRFILNAMLLCCMIHLLSCDEASSSESQQETDILEKQEQPSTPGIPANMFVVKPVQANDQKPVQDNPSPSSLSIRQGRFFSYALPQGWKLGEDGQFALSMSAPDNKAISLMVGNAGLMPDYPPQQFVYDKLMAINPERLAIGNGQNSKPVAGFEYAIAYPVSYFINGQPCKGLATCHVSTYYGGAVMAMTAALSDATQWEGYSRWLPLVAEQISANNGAAFGMRGIMQQNLKNSTSYAAAAKEYREWSQKNWDAVTNDRNSSQDRQQREFRENIGAVQSYGNPYDGQKPVELTSQYKYYWVDRHGTILGTNDPGTNPNHGSTQEWLPMEKK